MRYKAGILLLCVALVGGVAAAVPAQADPVDCVTQLATDLQNTPPLDDPNELVTIEGIDIDVDTNWSSEARDHIVAAAVRFAICAVPDPNEVIACIDGVVTAIFEDITRPVADDEIYARYVHLDSNGILHINGGTATGDALALAACL